MSGIFAQQTDSSHDNRTFHIHPPLLAAALLIIGLLLHLAGRHEEARFPFHELFGLLLVALGSGLCCDAAALFAAANTTRNPYGEPAVLVVAPPYTITRNPSTSALRRFYLALQSSSLRRRCCWRRLYVPL